MESWYIQEVETAMTKFTSVMARRGGRFCRLGSLAAKQICFHSLAPDNWSMIHRGFRPASAPRSASCSAYPSLDSHYLNVLLSCWALSLVLVFGIPFLRASNFQVCCVMTSSYSRDSIISIVRSKCFFGLSSAVLSELVCTLEWMSSIKPLR